MVGSHAHEKLFLVTVASSRINHRMEGKSSKHRQPRTVACNIKQKRLTFLKQEPEPPTVKSALCSKAFDDAQFVSIDRAAQI